jgi:hydroxyethylthiazole kinase-like uncharacterized protein yjeF
MRSPDQVLTATQMREAEHALIARGISVDELMERAGEGAADWVWRIAVGRSVTVLCGPGNNGGDGYVIARDLRDRGLVVRVVAPIEPATDAARAARTAWRAETTTDAHGGVLVDCLFGSGLSRPLSAEHAALLQALAARHDFLVAIDLPSGVATDDGALLGPVVRCDLTLALGAWKPAHFLMPALDLMGERRCVDIGAEAVNGAPKVFPRPKLPAPARGAHKYSRGVLGVVGGRMPGASLLAAEAAMRGGAGYVKLLSNRAPQAAPAALVVDDALLGETLADKRWSALLVGPGLGRDEPARERLAAVLGRGVPTVLDADALHLLDDDLLEGVSGQRLLLTPHEGELAALCRTFGIDAATKVDRARTLAEITGTTVLAKGPDNVLAEAGGRFAFFEPGLSWLSTAGTGDALAGIAASRLATRSDPFQAAGEAVWLHAEAARVAGPAMTSDDLSGAVSMSYARFL